MSDIVQYNKTSSIVKKLNSSVGSDVVVIYQNTGKGIDSSTSGLITLSVSGLVKNLKAYAKIGSLPEIKMPNFALEDSDTDKLYKTLDVEWKSPRKQLNLYISDNLTDWNPIGSISLLNPSGYPYRTYNLMELLSDTAVIEIGVNGRLGIGVQDVGYDLLTAHDEVTIYGSCTEEIVAKKNENSYSVMNSCASYQWDVNSTSQVILSANNARKYACVVNMTDSVVYLNLGSTATIGKGIPLIAKGSTYELTQSNIFLGDISAISVNGLTTLSGVECI